MKKSSSPVVSVVMPVLNNETFIKEAVDSILAQTMDDFELIVINDCSTDNSGEIAHSYDDKRITVVDFDIPEITRQYNFYYENIIKNCQSCYAYRFCGSCLFQINNIDNVDKEEFVCENFYDQDTFKNKLHHVFSFLEKYPNDLPQILENVILE